MKLPVRSLVLACSLVAALAAHAQGSTAKDIVLDRVSNTQIAGAVQSNDALVVSVLLESADGTLSPRSTAYPFNTGDRFRVKMLASREARVALYNTKPNGVLTPDPIWRGEVKPGQETISPRLVLDGASGSGTDQLHVVLEPVSAPSVFTWLGQWVGGNRAGKDIRLDEQNTPSATYLLTDAGKGLVSTIRINHQ
jgi:hypothetical protein